MVAWLDELLLLVVPFTVSRASKPASHAKHESAGRLSTIQEEGRSDHDEAHNKSRLYRNRRRHNKTLHLCSKALISISFLVSLAAASAGGGLRIPSRRIYTDLKHTIGLVSFSILCTRSSSDRGTSKHHCNLSTCQQESLFRSSNGLLVSTDDGTTPPRHGRPF